MGIDIMSGLEGVIGPAEIRLSGVEIKEYINWE